MRCFRPKLLPALLCLTSLSGFATTVAAQEVPYFIPVTGKVYVAPGGMAPQLYVIRLVDSTGQVVYSQAGPLVLDQEGHFDVRLGDSAEELTPAFLAKYDALSITLELDGELMDGSLPVGSVPYAKLAQEAYSARTLDGKSSTDFLPADHKVSWDDIEGKPDLSGSGDALKFSPPLMQQDALVGLAPCAMGQTLTTKNDGTWGCTTLPDAPTPWTVGQGLSLSQNNLSLMSCADGQILSVSGGQWGCVELQASTYMAGEGINATSLASKIIALADQGIAAKHIQDRTITSTKLAFNAVGQRELAANAVDSGAIIDGEVSSDDLADGVILDRHIPVASIDGAKLKNSSITTTHIRDATITNADISASAAIDPSKINAALAILNASSLNFSNSNRSTLFVNNLLGRVGIGKNNPNAALDVEGDVRVDAGTVQASAFRYTAAKRQTITVSGVSMMPSIDLPSLPITRANNATFMIDVEGSIPSGADTYLYANVSANKGDVLRKLTCYHLPASSGTAPLKYEAAIYEGSNSALTTTATSSKINVIASPAASLTLLNQSVSMTTTVDPETTFYMIQVKFPAGANRGSFRGCSIELDRSLL